jgi:ATP-dependent RNA helicase DDX24/MAK5
MTEWEHFDLNEKILKNLNHIGFTQPTSIQQKVLTYANARVDLIVQARTGEGKTLCYGIPIVNYILNFYERAEDKIKQISPVALIIVPTRELGVQVNDHLIKILQENNIEIENLKEQDQGENKKLRHYFNIKIANVLGGFAKPKQLKILNKYNPEIIIATPGRFWELLENEEAPLLSKLFRLRFLVLDEADRMTEKGHFRELKRILEMIYTKLETNQAITKEEREEDGEDISLSIKKSKTSLKETVDQLDKNKKGKKDKKENKIIKKALKEKNIDIGDEDIETLDPMMMFEDMEENLIEGIYDGEGEDEGDEEGLNNQDEEEDNEENEENDRFDYKKIRKEKKQEDSTITKQKKLTHSIHLRTILCSATIEKMHKDNKKGKNNQKSKNKPIEKDEEEKINLENLIKNLKFYNKLIYVKADTSKSIQSIEGEETQTKEKLILPEKLQLDCYKCNSTIKDYYLFHVLKENEGKKIIIFTNSISHTKKLYSIFSYFDFKITCLHSKMQQNQRIKNLEKFRTNISQILFCTDIGARGLDIPLVDIVIHYHIPKTTEPFIHRSGRTARAMKEGTSISLISEAEINFYKKIMKDINIKEFAMKTLNINQLEKYKSLFEFCKKAEKEEHQIKKKNRERQWLEKKANECELIFEDEEEGNEEEERVKREEKFLNKKRMKESKKRLQDKKVYNKIIASDIKRTSFLTPGMVEKLNSMMKDEKMKNMNFTKAIYEANQDAEAFRYKGKQRKKRYMRRRK